jgi:hypothetical protein
MIEISNLMTEWLGAVEYLLSHNNNDATTHAAENEGYTILAKHGVTCLIPRAVAKDDVLYLYWWVKCG